MIQGMTEGEYYYTDLVWEDPSEKETLKFKNKKKELRHKKIWEKTLPGRQRRFEGILTSKCLCPSKTHVKS